MTATPVAEPAGAQRSAVTPTARSPADVAEAPPVLTHAPRPPAGEFVAALSGEQYGGLAAVQAEWTAAGGTVLLTGRAPFLDLTGRARFGEDGSLDGTVDLTAQVGVLGLRVADCSWQVAGWRPDQAIPVPRVELRGSSVAVDLAGLPGGAACAPAEGLAARSDGATVNATLPGDALPPGQPLSPRLQEAFRGLLGVDLAGLVVHPDAELGGAPAFVSNPDLFFAPGIYGADNPAPLALLDQAIRAALAGLVGAVGTVEPPAPEAPPAAEAAPAADTTDVPATPAGPVAETSSTAEPGTPEGEGGTSAEVPPTEMATDVAAEGEVEGEPPPPVTVLMPEAPTQLSPAAQARGGGVARSAGGAARAARDLPTADENVGDARGAVAEPAAETAARAQQALATQLGGRPPPSPEIVALVDRIRTAIRENRPEDEDKLLETDPTHEAKQAGATVTGSVQGQADQVAGSYQAMNAPPAGAPALTPTPVVPPSPSSPGMAAPATQAAPDPIPPENLSLDADVAATDQKIAESGIDTRVTKEIPDGPFAEARAARGELGEVAQQTPAELATQQQQAIDTAQADMAQLQLQAVAALQASRSGTVGTVGEKQTGMVDHEQNTRESVSTRAQGIFDTAQKAVDQLLQPLPKTAIARWEAGLTKLSQSFHDSLDRVKKWIDERHEGVGGTILAIGDYIGGLPDWVTDEYNRAEREFGDGVGELLLSISSDVNGVIAAAQALVEGARRDIDAAFTEMAAEFPEWAAQEKARFSGLLDGLGAKVTQAQTSFVKDISNRAVTAVNEAHAEVEAKRQEAGGLIGRVVAAIAEFIEDPVRAIINGLLRLVGIPPSAFWALIEKIAQVISDIADDPENFVNNLVEGLKQGFQAFFDNFGQHVLKGFWDWLFSGLETPIPMPKDMSASALFSFALQLMGITWPKVREILVKHIGPTAVEVIEAAWQLISVLIERGPEGLVELVKEQLTPENIVQTILEAAVQYLVETLIKQVIIRVIGMLNPVGAIAQAIDLIYQVCKWIFNNAARIFRFIEAVVNGLADVVAGNVGGLAKKVEQGLAMLIPPVIDFLAGLLHLGDLPNEIAEVITKLQATVLKVLDRVIGFLAERGKALLKKMGLGGDDTKGKGDDELGTTVSFTAEGERHRLFVDREGASAQLMVASTPTTIPEWVARWRGMLDGDPAKPANEEDQNLAKTLLAALEAASQEANQMAEQLAVGFENVGKDPAKPTPPPDDSALEGRERSIANSLDRLFELFGEGDKAQQLEGIRAALPKRGRIRTEEVLDSWAADYLDTVYAKPLDGGGQQKIWFAQRFTVDALMPSEVLASGSHHVALLPYFEEKDRKGPDHGAGTQTFQDYALERRASPVRAPFFRSLGNRFAAKLREDGVLRLQGDGNSELLTRVRSIAYYASDANFGRFAPWPDSGVSVLVESTVLLGGGILSTLKAFGQGQAVGQVTGAEFAAELNKSVETRRWVSGLLREAVPGKHEWIPVSLVGEVLTRTLLTPAGLATASDWISLLENLRSPTDAVIFTLKVVPVTTLLPTGAAKESGILVVRAHAGAASYDAAGKRTQPTYHSSGPGSKGITTGTHGFHASLRSFYVSNSSMPASAWVDALLVHLRSIMYHGEDIGVPDAMLEERLGLFYTPPGGGWEGDRKVKDFLADAKARWTEIEDNFTQAKSGLSQ